MYHTYEACRQMVSVPLGKTSSNHVITVGVVDVLNY